MSWPQDRVMSLYQTESERAATPLISDGEVKDQKSLVNLCFRKEKSEKPNTQQECGMSPAPVLQPSPHEDLLC